MTLLGGGGGGRGWQTVRYAKTQHFYKGTTTDFETFDEKSQYFCSAAFLCNLSFFHNIYTRNALARVAALPALPRFNVHEFACSLGCLLDCQFVCLSVCLLATLNINYRLI